jgi:TctA family transporter
MLRLGWLCIKVAKRILRVPRDILMPVIVLFCIVGAFAINNTAFDVGMMLIAGLAAWLLGRTTFRSRRSSSASSSAGCSRRTSSRR